MLSVNLLYKEIKVNKRLNNIKKEVNKDYNNSQFSIDDELLKFIKKMPKGFDLHTHDFQSINAKTFIFLLKKYDYFFVFENDLLLAVVPKTEVQKDSKEYISVGKYIKDNGINKAIDLIKLQPSLLNQRWECFEMLFQKVSGIFKNKELYYEVYYNSFVECCENKLLGLEIRFYLPEDIAVAKEKLLIIRNAYYSVKNKYPYFSVKVICSSGRKKPHFNNTIVSKQLQNTITLKEKIKDEYNKNNITDFIIGFDLLNAEDSSYSLSYYYNILKKYSLKVNYYFHAGESRNKNSNIEYALKLNTKRIGHGINLYMNPTVYKYVRKNKMAVEICPVSNYKLGFVDNLENHPGREYIKNKIPCVICSDDGLFLESYNLCEDFYRVIIQWNLNLFRLKKMIYNSVKYSCVDNNEKEHLLNLLDNMWKSFIYKQTKKS